MYAIRPTAKFQKDLKRIEKRGYNISLLTDIIKKLANGEALPEKTEITRYQVIILAVENVILHLIGY